MSAGAAHRCFIENKNLFGNAKTNPENFNLYNGLANLADAVERMQRDIDAIKQAVQYIASNSR